MHPLLYPRRRFRGNAQKLDTEPQFLGEGQIDGRDMADAFDMDRFEIDLSAERQGRQDRQLMCGVDTVDIETGIGLGIALGLGLGQHLIELAPGVAHFRQDVIAGAVEDAVDPGNGVGRQPFAQPLEDRNAARHGRLEGQRHARPFGRGGQRLTVMGDQRLVGGDDVLAVGQRRRA